MAFILYHAAKLWNLLPHSMCTSDFAKFENQLASLDSK